MTIQLTRRSDGSPALADTEIEAQMLEVQGYTRDGGEPELAPREKSADPSQ